MRYAIAMVVTGLAGCCCGPGATTGWRFEVGRPSQAFAPALISTSSPVHAVNTLATVPGFPAMVPAPAQILATPQVMPPCVPVGTPTRSLQATATDCTLQEVCSRLASVERHLGEKLAAPKLMPKGE